MGAEINSKSFGFVTNPDNVNADDKMKDTALKLKNEAEKKSQSLFTKLEEQRKIYANIQKEYYESKATTKRLKDRSNAYESSEYLRGKREEEYEASMITTQNAKRSRDMELYRLQSRTDDYCSAQKSLMHISVFVD